MSNERTSDNPVSTNSPSSNDASPVEILPPWEEVEKIDLTSKSPVEWTEEEIKAKILEYRTQRAKFMEMEARPKKARKGKEVAYLDFTSEELNK